MSNINDNLTMNEQITKLTTAGWIQHNTATYESPWDGEYYELAEAMVIDAAQRSIEHAE